MKMIMLKINLMLAVSAGAANTTAPAATCYDLTKNDSLGDSAHKNCFDHTMWAMVTGSKTHTDWYTNWPDVTALNMSEKKISTIHAWQCVLHHKTMNSKDNDGQEGHNCTKPCNFNDKCILTPPTPAPTAAAVAVADTTTVKKSDGGMPGWAWALIVVGVCCGLPCLGLMCSALICYEAVSFILDPILGGKKGVQKKKRSVKKSEAPAPPAAAAAPMPVITTSVPMPVYQSYAAPTMTYPAAPVTYAAPMSYTMAPATYAAPAPASMSYAAPAMHYVAPEPMHYAPASVSYAAAPATYATGSVSYAAPVMHYAAEPQHMIAAEPITAFPQ